MTSTRLAERAQQAQSGRPSGAVRPGVRNQILEAALVEFAEKGFQEASLAAIARRLGVTAPLVLYHFGSKANLWREALEVFCASFAATVNEAIAQGNELEGRDALRLIVRRLVHFFAANRAAYRLMRDEGGVDSGHDEWFATRNLNPVIRRIENVYNRAIQEGAMRAAPFETTFFMILGAISCYLESRALAAHLFGASDEREHWIDDYADQVVGLCFEGLLIAPRRERPMLAALRAATMTVSEASLR
ncbi:MAG TPA: TetR/AcrR family transcriptional regulator [Candidatus Binatia bacterium]|jgi:AcrR family transcriptional regulator